MKLSINPRFERLLCPLSPLEFTHLEQSIVSHGCREKIIVWSTGNVIIDGHNRYSICTRNKVPFEIELLDFENEDDVEDWIDRNQLGRRNLTPEDYQIVSGRIYNRRKQQGKRTDVTLGQIGLKSVDTAKEVAAELGTSERTIKRNGQRAEVYDKLVEAGEQEAAAFIKSATQAEVVAVKDLPVYETVEVIKSKPQVIHNSGNNEWYTPVEFIEAAREVLGEITTDPASCELAQGNVKAKTFFTETDNGLVKEWLGSVWMNPPYGSSLIGEFCDKLVEEIEKGNCKQAVVLVNNATETRWFQLLSNNASACCFPSGRIKFLDSTGNPKQSPVQGQCFLYFGKYLTKFEKSFSAYGCVWVK